MTDSATSRLGARQQSQGSNTNTWGDDKLNEALRLIDRSMHGVESLAMTGDTTLSWTNYIATNTGQVAFLTLTGSLSAAANLVVPSVQWAWKGIKNSTGQTITVKTSAGTGVTIPNGRQIPIACDGSDCAYAGQNFIGADITETNARDLMDKTAVETAIATVSLPATAGTVLVSATDTTAGYAGSKVNVTGSGAAVVTASIVNPAANEVKTFAVAVGALALTNGGLKTSSFSAAVNTRYFAEGAGIVATGPSSAAADDVIVIAVGASDISFTPNGLKANGGTNAIPLLAFNTYTMTYGVTSGWC